MPVYSYICRPCKREWENFRFINHRKLEVCKCGNKAEIAITTNSKPIVKEYYCEGLQAVITGPKQRERIAREKGLTPVG